MLNQYQENNKRIAKNTLMLYIRMFLVMFISLFTVRIVLNCLGAEDYGIYNVVGGIVVLFSFLSNTMSSASQRYFAYEIGRGDYHQVNKVFSVTLQLYVICSFIILLLSETVGLWYLNNEMTIPSDRLFAANVVYQLSIVSFIVNILATPYQAIIIAQEKMNIFSYIGVVEVVLKLIMCVLLDYVNYDKLITYSILMTLSTISVSLSYVYFSKRSLYQLNFRLCKDMSLIKEITSYSGWTLFGGVATVIRSQGLNILLNAFFNPTINAARGIAFQVNNAINQLSSNFYTAVRPQVTKYYAQQETDQCLKLVFSSSRLSYYLILIFAVPLIRYTHLALSNWLVEVPDYALLFTKLVIITAMIDSMSHPLMTLAQATGKIKCYQIVVGGLLILNLPISYLFLKFGFGPEITMIVSIFISLCALMARLIILNKITLFPVGKFIKEVILKLLIVTIAALVIIWGIGEKIVFGTNLLNCILTYTISIIICALLIIVLGMNSSERKSIVNIFLRRK